MGTSRGCYKLPAACVPLSLRHRMNYGSCCFEPSIVWVSESPGLLKFFRSYLLSLIPLMGGIFISNRFPGNANSSKLVLYLEAIRITWRPFLQGWAPFPKGISQSGVVRMQVFTKLPCFFLLSGCESSLELVSIMLSFFFFFFNYLFIYVCVGLRFCARAFSSCGSGGHSSSRCAGLSLSRPLVAKHRLQMRRLSSCGSRAQLLCSMWDLPRPGSNPCPLHWQADSQPLRHQGSPMLSFFIPPFLLLILLSNCMLLVYINTFDLGILIFCDLAKLMY